MDQQDRRGRPYSRCKSRSSRDSGMLASIAIHDVLSRAVYLGAVIQWLAHFGIVLQDIVSAAAGLCWPELDDHTGRACER